MGTQLRSFDPLSPSLSRTTTAGLPIFFPRYFHELCLSHLPFQTLLFSSIQRKWNQNGYSNHHFGLSGNERQVQLSLDWHKTPGGRQRGFYAIFVAPQFQGWLGEWFSPKVLFQHPELLGFSAPAPRAGCTTPGDYPYVGCIPKSQDLPVLRLICTGGVRPKGLTRLEKRALFFHQLVRGMNTFYWAICKISRIASGPNCIFSNNAISMLRLGHLRDTQKE